MAFHVYGNNYLYVDLSDVKPKLEYMQSVLKKAEYEKLMYRTFAEVGRKAKTMVAKEVQQDYVVTQQWVKSQIGAYKLQFGGQFPVTCTIPLKGVKGSIGGRFPLSSPARSRRQGYVRSTIVKGQISTMPPHMTNQGGNPPFVANGVAYTRRTAERLPIVRVVGLGVPQMPLNRSQDKVQDSILDYTERRLDHHFARMLSGKW